MKGNNRRLRAAGRKLTGLILSAAMVVSLTPYMGSPTGQVHGADVKYAAPATKAQLEQAEREFAVAPAGGVLKVTDGKLYVWGSNDGGILGIGETSAETPRLLSPTVHPVFNGSDSIGLVRQVVAASFTGSYVYTDKNEVYGWGGKVEYYVTAAGDGGVSPYKLDTSALKGKSIKYIGGADSILAVQDEDDVWYVAGLRGSGAASQILTGQSGEKYTSVLLPVQQSMLDQIDGGAIKKLVPYRHAASCYIISSNNELYTLGYNGNMMFGKTSTVPYNVMDNDAELKAAMSGMDLIEALNTNGLNSTLIDKTGSVWAVGQNGSNCITSKPTMPNGLVDVRVKVFDSSVMQKKVVKTFLSTNLIVYLCDDNTLYATGSNANQFITADQPSTAGISTPMQVASDISQKDTIVGVYPSNLGVTVLTKNGDLYYMGSNSEGTAGTGSTEEVAPGEVIEPPGLPPVEPATANEISFEMEMEDGRTYAMDPNDPTKVNMTSGGAASVINASDLKIRAGEAFKLNVYFNDFAKLNSFFVPIRFDPNLLQVVKGNDVPYGTKSVEMPGAVGASTGIVSYFNSETWSGGSLASGNSTPKISNGGGWISVQGYSTNKGAGISGTQKMFSIRFMAKGRAVSPTSFRFASEANAPVSGLNGYTGPTYDDSMPSAAVNGAYWTIASEEPVSLFDFAGAVFPSFQTYIVDLNELDLSFTRDSGAGSVAVVDRSGDYGQGKAIDYSNKDAAYTVKVLPGPENASFANADWSYELVSGGEGLEVTDYISVLKTEKKSVQLKISDTLDTQKVTFGAIRITASPADAASSSVTPASVLLYIQSLNPPKSIDIQEPDGTSLAEMIYHYHPTATTNAALENKVFTVKPEFDNQADAVNRQVVWKLLNKDRTEIDLSNPSAAFAVDGIQDGVDVPSGSAVTGSGVTQTTEASITLLPQKTTFAEDCVILRAESAYDSSVYDEVILRNHFYPSSLTFQRDIVRIPINTSKDLESLLSIEPQDVYETDLEWKLASPSPAGGPYIDFTGTSRITTKGKATTEGAYEYITVTDKNSRESATVKIQVLDLDSPVKPDDVSITNQVNDEKDTITIQRGLKVGDIIKIYPSYEATAPALTLPALTEQQLASGDAFTFNLGFLFPDGLESKDGSGLLDSGGGEFGISITRDVEGFVKEHEKVPLDYNAEPSHVYGYVRLAGKGEFANAGVEVKLESAKHSETVYTKADGMFEFTEYIPPGNYWLTIAQEKYLKRIIKPNDATGYQGLVIPRAADFCISSDTEPIYLYPGDLNGDQAVNSKDITGYVQSWLGRTDSTAEDFSKYDFVEDVKPAINLFDLNSLLFRNGWLGDSYPNWSTPAQ